MDCPIRGNPSVPQSRQLFTQCCSLNTSHAFGGDNGMQPTSWKSPETPRPVFYPCSTGCKAWLSPMGERIAISCHLSIISLPLPFMNCPLSVMDYYYQQKKGWERKLLTDQNLINKVLDKRQSMTEGSPTMTWLKSARETTEKGLDCSEKWTRAVEIEICLPVRPGLFLERIVRAVFRVC